MTLVKSLNRDAVIDSTVSLTVDYRCLEGMLIEQNATKKKSEEVKRIQEEIDMPKPRNYIMMLWKPILKAAKHKYGDLITEIKEVPSDDGTGDITFEIQMINDERLMEVNRFFSSQTYHVLVNHGVVINVYIQPSPR